MTTYHDKTPFLYAIGWTDLNIWYLGVRYAKTCSPLDLWTNYFTSSKYVADLREWYGEPDHIEVLATGDSGAVQELEVACLTEWSLHKDARWLNRNIGGKSFAPDEISEETRAKKRAARATQPPMTPEGRASVIRSNKRRICSDETRAKLSAALSGRTFSDETKAKMSTARKLRPPLSAEGRAKISAANKSRPGRKHTDEAKAKMSAARKKGIAEKRDSRTMGLLVGMVLS